MKIRPVVAELFHAGGRTELTVAFRNFANAPKKRIDWKLPVTLTQKFLGPYLHKLQLFKN